MLEIAFADFPLAHSSSVCKTCSVCVCAGTYTQARTQARTRTARKLFCRRIGKCASGNNQVHMMRAGQPQHLILGA